jgi:hypothetical protein
MLNQLNAETVEQFWIPEFKQRLDFLTTEIESLLIEVKSLKTKLSIYQKTQPNQISIFFTELKRIRDRYLTIISDLPKLLPSPLILQDEKEKLENKWIFIDEFTILENLLKEYEKTLLQIELCDKDRQT